MKELKADALAKLKAPALSPSDTTNPRQRVLYLEQLDVAGLKSRLEKVPDYRSYAGKYKLVPTLALIIAAVLCGAKDAKAVHRWISALAQDFLKSLGFRQAPSYSTIWRQTVLDQRMTDAKSNEIPKVQEILHDAPIDANVVVTADQLQVGELNFPGARTIAKVTRQREQKRTGKVSKPETVACISNLVNPTPEEFGRLLQRRWNVEALFHVRDATMLEDRHTMHTNQGPMNFSMLRNVAVSLKHLTGEMSLPDSTARFQQNIYAFLAPFQVDPLALAENPPSLAA